MQAKRRSYQISAAPAVSVADAPSRYWGFAVIAACAASWAVIIGAAKLLLAVI
ncbi:MAG TPA: hypothetical protein VNF99_15210 [Stellaceae bacterium]|nr:hypothetical protein [Stellaceae bacterium]